MAGAVRSKPLTVLTLGPFRKRLPPSGLHGHCVRCLHCSPPVSVDRHLDSLLSKNQVGFKQIA